MAQYDWHSCPASVRTQVQTLCEQVQAVLEQRLVGIYLHGSLALGCFNVELSDLDLLVVTSQSMAVETKRQLMQLFLHSSQAPCPLELSVLVFSDMHPFRHPLPFDLHYSEYWRHQTQQDLETSAWQQWNDKMRADPDLAAHLTVARHRGLTLFGQPAADVLPVVPSQDYLSSLLGDYLDARGVRAQKPMYFILNACRIHAYRSQQRICSKDEGGVYGLHVLPTSFHPLIQHALNLYRGQRSEAAFDEHLLTEFATSMDQVIL